MKYTLITGASQGMGLLMAKNCYFKKKCFTHFFTNENLSNIAIEISNEQVSCHYFEIDLTLNRQLPKKYLIGLKITF